MTEKKRVVITGTGVVSCFGSDVNAFYDALLKGKSGITPMTAFDSSEYPTRFCGNVTDFDTEGFMDKKQARRVDPFIKYTFVAGKKALLQAGFEGEAFDALDKDRVGVLIGTGMGGMTTFYNGSLVLNEKGFKRISPFFVPFIITNMGSALLAQDLGFMGPNYSISTACATSNHSIISAAQHIQRGDADVMVCGGAEAPISPIGVAGFVACKALSERNDEMEKASRPWDKDRDGFVIGEGSGVLVLESLEHAQKRGATILGEYLGGAVNCDAYHITEPRPDGSGVAKCINLALKDGGVDCTRVNYINAHATSTPAGDLCEIRGFKSVFGDHMKNVKINGTKSMTGHCLGAAAGIEAIATLKAIETGKLHPTINLENPEEEIEGIDVVPNKAIDHTVDVALSTSFGFGGHNSALVLSRFQ